MEYKDMDTKKVDEIKALVKSWTEGMKEEDIDKSELARKIEHYYIFGNENMEAITKAKAEAPQHEHYKIDDLYAIVCETLTKE